MIPSYDSVGWEVAMLEYHLPSLGDPLPPAQFPIYVNSRFDYSFYVTGRYREAFIDVQDYTLEARLYTYTKQGLNPALTQDLGAWFTPVFGDDERAYIAVGPGTMRQLASSDIGKLLKVRLRVGGASGILVESGAGRAIIG